MYKYGWVCDLPDHRDLLYRAIRPGGLSVPPVVDLRPQCPIVANQWNLGSCTANALAKAVEFEDIKNGIEPPPLSRLFLYYEERDLEGTTSYDGGAQLRDGIKVLSSGGICAEELWPYDVSKYYLKPPPEAYKDALERRITSYHRILGLEEMLTCLAEGFPFVFGISIYESFESDEVARTGEVPFPNPGERLLGGHALLAVGYDQDKEIFIVQNSWGVAWGQGGFCFIPFEYLRGLGDDFWTVRR